MELVRTKPTQEDIGNYCAIEKTLDGLKVYSNITDPMEAKAEIEKCFVYFIKIKDQIIGTVSYEWKDKSHAYIAGLVIKPEYQGQGYARQAMEKVLEEIGQAKIIDLVTHPENSRAIKLYQSLGFIPEKTIENYFGDGEPRIVMTKNYA